MKEAIIPFLHSSSLLLFAHVCVCYFSGHILSNSSGLCLV